MSTRFNGGVLSPRTRARMSFRGPRTCATVYGALLAPYPADEMTCWPVNRRRQRQEQRLEPDRADRSARNLRGCSAAAFVLIKRRMLLIRRTITGSVLATGANFMSPP